MPALKLESPPDRSRNSLILDICAALESEQVTYCVLRGADDPENQYESGRELDLLVLPEHICKLERILVSRGFASLPSWGHAPHHFFVAYEREHNAWLKIDAVTDIRYGNPIRVLRLGISRQMLSARRWQAPAYVLSMEHLFLKLLCSCLIHKGNFDESDRGRLTKLWNEIEIDRGAQDGLNKYVGQYLAPAITWTMVNQVLRTENWNLLLARRSLFVRQLFRRDPVGSLWRSLWGRSLRKMRPLLFAIRKRGLAVALLAPDGGGKTTCARGLALDPFIQARVVYMGTNVESRTVVFPLYEWLEHECVLVKGRHSLFAKLIRFSVRVAEHWCRLGLAWWIRLRGRFVVFDRYVYDAWLFQQASTPLESWKRRFFECRWPSPDLVIVLDAPGSVLYSRKGEHTAELLEQQRVAYSGLRRRMPEVVLVDANRSQTQVQAEVISLIWKKYAWRTREGACT